MMLSSPSYIYRRGGVVYWRRAVPRRLQKFFSRSSLRFSLTSYLPSRTRFLVRQLNASADAVFAAIDALTGDVMELAGQQVGTMAEAMLRLAVDALLEEAEGRRALAGLRTPAAAEAARQQYLAAAAQLRTALACNDLSAALPPLQTAAARLGLSLPDDPAQTAPLARRMLRLQVTAAQINADREIGLYDDAPLGIATPAAPLVAAFAPYPAAVPLAAAAPTATMPAPAAAAAAAPPGAAPLAPAVAPAHPVQPPQAPVAAAQQPAPPSLPPAVPEEATAEPDAAQLVETLARARKEREQRAAITALGRTVRETFELQRDKHEWTDNIERQVRKATELFCALMGDMHLAEIDEGTAMDFKTKLGQLPRDYDKAKAYRDRSPAELVAMAPSRRKSSKADEGRRLMALTTITKHVHAMSRLFRDARTGEANPFQGKGYKKSQMAKAADQREKWDAEALTALLEAPLYTGCASKGRRKKKGNLIIRDGLYWTPLLAMRGGFREQEVAQLFVDDVKCIEGIWVIDVQKGATDGRHLKNPNAERRIPIAQALIEAGFLDHVMAQRQKGEKFLFPEFHGSGTYKAGAILGKRFDRYKKAFVDDRFVFYGLRHTFCTAAMHVDHASKSLVEKLMGHDVAGESGGRYFKGFDLQVLKQVVDKLALPPLPGL